MQPCSFLEALADPQHDEHEHWTEWIGENFDPEAFDLDSTDAALAAFAWTARPLPAER